LSSDTGTGTGTVIVHRTMSLDGFISGPDHAMEWVFGYLAPDEFPEMIRATGAILAGRRTYEVGRRDAGQASGEVYGGAWSGPQFVLTHQPPENPPTLIHQPPENPPVPTHQPPENPPVPTHQPPENPPVPTHQPPENPPVPTHQPPENPPVPAVTFLSGDIEAAVATARKAAGGKNLEIFGADVAGQALQRGLVDEIVVHIVPVLLGGGTLFSSPGLPRIDLEPVSTTRSGPVTTLRFRVRK
jgi:dihydrofolate reductase